MHKLECLFIVLIQNFISLQIFFIIEGENGFNSGICLHPFVLLDLLNGVPLVWVFDKHMPNQVLALCGGNENKALKLSKLNMKFAVTINLISLKTLRNTLCAHNKERAKQVTTTDKRTKRNLRRTRSVSEF